MNGQYVEERVNTFDVDERVYPAMDSPVIENLGPLTDKVPVDAEYIHEIPMNEPFPIIAPMDEEVSMNEPIIHDSPFPTNGESPTTLLNRDESERFRSHWNEIQGRFVDEPRPAVQEADALVSEVIEKITQMFANEHSSLKSQWNQGNDVSTENLRKALQRYRSFFNRLVSN